MAGRFAHVVSVVHSTPGRARLRLPWLHDQPDEAPAVADRLSSLEGVKSVEVRAYTGSVLVRFDPTRLDEGIIVEELRAAIGARRSEVRGGGLDEVRRLAHVAQAEGTGVAHAAAALFKGIDADILCATEGRLDLADVAALGFVAVGVSSVIATERLRLPSWYDLAWWAYQVFTREERKAIDHTPHPLAPVQPPPAGPPDVLPRGPAAPSDSPLARGRRVSRRRAR